MLSFILDLRRSPSLFFIPLFPSNLRPFGAPPSIGKREYPRKPLPLEGAAERSEAGLASFFAVDRVLSQTAHLSPFLFHLYHLLETIFPALFHPARTLFGSLRSPPSPRGEGFVRPYCFSTYACIRSDNARKAMLSFRCLPHWGRGTASAVDRVLSLTAYLRRSSPLIFHTARTLSGSLRSPPSPRGEGVVSRTAVSSFRSLPHWGRGTASAVDRVLSLTAYLRRSSPLIFHTARTLSGSLRSPPSPRGEG